MFPLTNAIFWLYSLFVNAKSLTGFDSLNYERIWPLCGFFYVRKSLRLCFLGRKRGEPKGSPVLVTGLSTRVFPPAPCPARAAVFPKPFKQRSMNHGSI